MWLPTKERKKRTRLLKRSLDEIDGTTSPNKTPKNKEPRKRNRKATPKMWKRNVAAQLRQSGLEYVNRKQKVVPKKAPLPVDCSKCRLVRVIPHFSSVVNNSSLLLITF